MTSWPSLTAAAKPASSAASRYNRRARRLLHLIIVSRAAIFGKVVVILRWNLLI